MKVINDRKSIDNIHSILPNFKIKKEVDSFSGRR